MSTVTKREKAAIEAWLNRDKKKRGVCPMPVTSNWRTKCKLCVCVFTDMEGVAANNRDFTTGVEYQIWHIPFGQGCPYQGFVYSKKKVLQMYKKVAERGWY